MLQKLSQYCIENQIIFKYQHFIFGIFVCFSIFFIICALIEPLAVITFMIPMLVILLNNDKFSVLTYYNLNKIKSSDNEEIFEFVMVDKRKLYYYKKKLHNRDGMAIDSLSKDGDFELYLHGIRLDVDKNRYIQSENKTYFIESHYKRLILQKHVNNF